jgi:hypothetical protein
LLGPIGYKVERSFKATTSSNRIDTDIDFTISSSELADRAGDERVTSFEVFVNGTPVAATKSNIDDKFVINLTTAYSIDDTVSYVLNLNEKGPDAWKNVDDTDFSADANDIVEWDGSKWVNIWNSSEDNETTYVTNVTTGQQFYWNNYYWQSAVDGYYPRGTWTITL